MEKMSKEQMAMESLGVELLYMLTGSPGKEQRKNAKRPRQR